MCCIFTCCGWMIDLVQRLWTFTMSCCISSAVCCVMLTSSMSGIALGYNYSLAEYIDLKETNVSIYLKRGVFDDEIADDMDWRRSGHLPVAGHLGDNNLRTGAPADDESTTLRSGRRLDDSVMEADDQNKFESSLMKLTAKPPFEDTPPRRITDDLEMAESVTRYPMGSLNQMKAIQSLIDSRRAMATGGTTNSPLATYGSLEGLLPYLPMKNNPNEPGNPDVIYRRMMTPGSGMKPPYLNPARYAVPSESIGSRDNWIVPKNPLLFDQKRMPDYFILSPTYPSAITVAPAIVRPTNTITAKYQGVEGPVMFVTRTIATTVATNKKSAVVEKLEKESEPYNERFLLQGDIPSKKDYVKLPNMGKSSEEEYEDEIKGLPVRKRRSIKVRRLVGKARNTAEINIIHPVTYNNTRDNSNSSSIKNISTTTNQTDSNKKDNSVENNFTNNKNQSVVEESNDSEIGIKVSNKDKTNQQMDDKLKEHKVETTREQDLGENKQGKSLLDRLITTIETKKLTLAAETTPKAFITAKKIKIQARRKSFESKILTSKYVSNNKATKLYDMKQTALSNQEILSSISVSLNEAGLLRNPVSSTFVKFLQSTLM